MGVCYRSPHLVYDCKYHVVFCPKYRRPILKGGLDGFVKETFLSIAEQKQFQIIEMEVMPDHVHLLISCNPRFGIMNCIRALKRYSVSPMHQYDPSLKHRSVSMDTVKDYIASQKEK